MKKYILIIIILAAALFFVAGCRGNRKAAVRNAGGKINVTTTIFAPYDFVRQIAGDRINLFMLLPPGSESHSFEPSPRDIITIQNSDIFIYIGGESDAWIDRILDSMQTENMNILALMETVDVVEEEIVEGMEDPGDDDEHDDHGHEEIAYDEHVWTSPKNAALIVQAITELLCEADAANAGFYRQNAAAYIEALEELDAAFEEVTAGAKRDTFVFGDRFPFRYLADAYELNYYAAFPGCSTETEPSAATVAFLINKIRAEQIPVVFHIELSNERMADTISAETGAKKLLLHACHNITKRDFDAGLGYLDLMRLNIESLREALN
ncbi:MAG: metal ABC transporter substrate-binding protein [Treponema sp.]|nr:metal ABC transporter substrate-binding protein [Treponema sp.]